MADIDWFNTKINSLGLPARIWGTSGESSRRMIEQQLGIRLDGQISEFIQTIGNATIGPFLIAIAGNDQGQMSAITETASARTNCPALPSHYVKIMEHAGESYFYDSRSGGVFVFDSLNVDPAITTLSFEDFDKFLEWAFEETKLQSEDKRFAF